MYFRSTTYYKLLETMVLSRMGLDSEGHDAAAQGGGARADGPGGGGAGMNMFNYGNGFTDHGASYVGGGADSGAAAAGQVPNGYNQFGADGWHSAPNQAKRARVGPMDEYVHAPRGETWVDSRSVTPARTPGAPPADFSGYR